MDIIENPFSIEFIKDNNSYYYNKPNYKGYNYLNLLKKLYDLNITRVRIGIKTCNIVSDKKILIKLKKKFGYNNVVFTGSYKDYIYQYNINLMNNNEYLNFKILNQL